MDDTEMSASRAPSRSAGHGRKDALPSERSSQANTRSGPCAMRTPSRPILRGPSAWPRRADEWDPHAP